MQQNLLSTNIKHFQGSKQVGSIIATLIWNLVS